jgi:hypothetical protein
VLEALTGDPDLAPLLAAPVRVAREPRARTPSPFRPRATAAQAPRRRSGAAAAGSSLAQGRGVRTGGTAARVGQTLLRRPCPSGYGGTKSFPQEKATIRQAPFLERGSWRRRGHFTREAGVGTGLRAGS